MTRVLPNSLPELGTDTLADAFPVFQVLNEHGEIVNEQARAAIPDQTLVELMREMVWMRAFDSRITQLNRQGTLANFAPFAGQEASMMGSLSACSRQDFLVPTYRDVVLTIKHGLPMHQAFLWWRSHQAGNQVPATYHGHIPQVIVGGGIPHAAGVAMGKKMRSDQHICLAYCGDGATSQGDFYEGLNFAGVAKAPLLVIVNNNGYAISTPLSAQTAAHSIAHKGLAAGVASLRVDGQDALAMYVATRAAREYCLTTGPVLLESLTYRFGPHTMSDDPTRYRDSQEVDAWRARCPLARLRTYLVGQGLWDESEEPGIVEGVHQEIKEALGVMAKTAPMKVSDLLRHTFENPPRLVQEQIDQWVAREAQG